MPTTNLTEVSVFTANVGVPQNGDDKDATVVEAAFQALANRTTYINDGKIKVFDVASLAALKALTDVPEGAIRRVKNTAGNPGTLWIYDSTSTVTGNDATLVTPDSGAGRWHAIQNLSGSGQTEILPSNALVGLSALATESATENFGAITAAFGDVINQNMSVGDTVEVHTACVADLNGSDRTWIAGIQVVQPTLGTVFLPGAFTTLASTVTDDLPVRNMGVFTAAEAGVHVFSQYGQYTGGSSGTPRALGPLQIIVRRYRPLLGLGKTNWVS